MRRTAMFACALVAVLVCSATAFAGPGKDRTSLEMYTAVVSRATAEKMVREGYDVALIKRSGAKVRVDLVLSQGERAKLARQGVKVKLKRDRKGRTISALAEIQAQGGFKVWRSWDEDGGIEDEIYQIAAQNPDLVKLVDIGDSIEDRDILALKVTANANTTIDGTRPAVFYNATQHAREWISTEVNRRVLLEFIRNYRQGHPTVKNVIQNKELWFVLVANPDGYQYTFDEERLWRKNKRDNLDPTQFTSVDGVDPNRNFPEHWNYDIDGSSSIFSSETYRGTEPHSEPETDALMSLMEAPGLNPKGKRFDFMVNYHSYGQLLLYTFGWQQATPSADDPIFVALSGTDKKPAIDGFDPGVGAELYITNGETTDYAHVDAGTLAWTPELSEKGGGGFIFPDDEGAVQAEFTKNWPFALDVAMSAGRVENPVSHLKTTTPDFYLDVATVDPEKANNPIIDFAFPISYGDPQPVRVGVRKSLGPVSLNYQITRGGVTLPAVPGLPTTPWLGGERYGGEAGSLYYHVVEGTVTGTQPGDQVKVWFTAGGKTSPSFTYTRSANGTGADVLLVAAEDYTGISPGLAGPNPRYVDDYEAALGANGIDPDVYDVDAMGRQAPTSLGVLSHYDAVVFYTGDDIITRETYMRPGNVSRLANDEMLNLRAYLNEGGRLLYTGKFAGVQYTAAHGEQLVDLERNEACYKPDVAKRCELLSDDFHQYYLGAYFQNDGQGMRDAPGMTCDHAALTGCTLFDVEGTDEGPFEDMSWAFNGAGSAGNQNHSQSFLPTSTFMEPTTYPQFDGWRSARYDRPGGPFDPADGEWYVYSGVSDVSYKQIKRTISVPATGTTTMSFQVSYNTEPAWDFVFVEAHTLDATPDDDWTTLPDLNGNTTSSTGDSCAEGWHELHPWLERYQGADCSGTGSTGSWNAASGDSHGWQEWEVDLSAYAGKDVEVYISYASDWAVQGLGTFVDQIVLSNGAAGSTSFETGMDGWEVTGPPEGSAPNFNNFERITGAGFTEGAVVASAPSDAGATFKALFFGFGIEGISSDEEGVTAAEERAEVMGEAMDFLLSP